MKSHHFLITAVAATAVFTGWLPQALAQAPGGTKHVVLSNVPAVGGETEVNGNAAIPLTGLVQVDPEGNIVVTCQEDVGGKCSNVGVGGEVIGTPGVTFSGPSSNVVATGQSLTWSTTNAHACYGLSASPAVAGWTSKAWAVENDQNYSYPLDAVLSSVTPGTSASYSFTLRCYSIDDALDGADAVAYKDETLTVTFAPPSGGGAPTGGSCDTYLETLSTAERAHFEAYRAENRMNSASQSYNFTAVSKTFFAQTGKTLGVDTGQIGPTANPALPGALGDNQYLALSFSMPAESQTNSGKFALDNRPSIGGPKDHLVLMSISPCPGDFRPRNNSSADTYLSGFCRSTYNGMFVVKGGSRGIPTDGCPTPVGQTMYLNVALRNLSVLPGSDIPADTCNSGQHCGVSTALSN